MQTSSMQPLTGLKVLVTRPKGQTDLLSARLRALGATTIELPTIEIIAPTDTGNLDAAISRLGTYDWVIFTSVHGVEFFLKRMVALGVPANRLSSRKLAAIGPATAATLTRSVKTPDYVPKQFLSEKIAEGLRDLRGQRVLLPRADIASKKLPSMLVERGAIVDDVVVYRTVTPRELTPENVKLIFEEGVDLVTFTSPSTVRNLAQAVGEKQLPDFLKRTKVACIGPVTLQAARELGISVVIVAVTHTIVSLVEAIVREIGTV